MAHRKRAKLPTFSRVGAWITTHRFGLLLTSFITVIAALVLTCGVMIYVMRLNNFFDDPFKISYLIVRAVDDLNQPLVEDPMTGNSYIPAAKLFLPPAESNLGGVLYNYSPPLNGTAAQLNIVSKQDVRQAETPVLNAQTTAKAFDAVPRLQACARGIAITFVPQEGQKEFATRQLLSGATAYFYTEPNCLNDKLLRYAERINSY